MKNFCENCPYKKDSPLCHSFGEARKEEFWESHIERAESFYCHKTCETSTEGSLEQTNDSKLCFGALATQWKVYKGFNPLAAFLHRSSGVNPEELYGKANCPQSLEDWKSQDISNQKK
jgi:hypothetical protein